MNLALLYLLFLALISSLKSQEITIEDPLSSCKGFTISNSGLTPLLGYAVDGGGGDVNGDKIPDIVISDYQYPNPSIVYVIYGRKTGYIDIDVSTMTSEQGFKITGALLCGSDNTNLISISGDVDGDGVHDIIIGASLTDSSKGAAYVIYGKNGGYTDFDVSTLTSDKGFKIIGPAGGVGWSLNTKLDINGDKINDILLGAHRDGGTAGAAYIIYGQTARDSDLTLATMPASRGFKISGFTAGYLGASLASAGDFNGDYVEDALITAPGASSLVGNAYVVYGKNGSLSDFPILSMPATEGFTLTGQSPYSKLALVASDAGDFNNDSISDIVMSAWDASTVEGYALIFYGKKGGPADLSTSAITPSDGFKIQGVTSGDQFGSSLSSIQDINGDGITDLLIGAKGYSSNLGALYIIFGRTDQPSTIDLSTLTSDEGVKIVGSLASGTLGYSVRSLGDINQDGVSDVIVSAPGAARAYVLFGPNAWGCDSCLNSTACAACQAGYNFTYNGLCFQECPVYAPYQVGSRCFSERPKDPESVEVEPEGISKSLKDAVKRTGYTTYATNKVLNIWTPSSALPFIYGQLKTSIIYMRYMNISRTTKLEELYQLYADTDMGAVPFITMSNSIKNAFPVELLPYMIRKYELPSSFIANFGDDLFGLAIVFGLLITSELAYFLTKRWNNKNLSTVKLILHRVSTTCQNFLVGSFGESVGPIIFYSTLEFRHRSTGKGYYALSPLTCCFSMILGLSVIVLCLWILRKFHNIRRRKKSHSKEEFELLEKKYEGIAVLFEDFDNSSLIGQSGFLVFCIRALFEGLVIGLLSQYPLTQAVLLLLLTFTALAYTIAKGPFTSKLALIQEFILIASLFTCNFCLTIMAGTDVTYHNFSNVLQGTSGIIFWALVLFQWIPLFFFTINLIKGLWKLHKWYSTIRSKKAKRLPSKIAQICPASSSTYQSVLSINNSRNNLPETILSPQMSRDHRPLVLSFEDENISPSQQKLDLSSPNRRPDKALQRVSLRERMRRIETSQKSKELVDKAK